VRELNGELSFRTRRYIQRINKEWGYTSMNENDHLLLKNRLKKLVHSDMFTILMMLLFALTLSSCATKPMTKSIQTEFLEGSEPILVFNPMIKVKSIEDELPVNEAKYDIGKAKEYIENTAQSLLVEKGFIISNGKITANSLEKIQNDFNRSQVKLFRSQFNKETNNFLDEMNVILNGTCVLFIKTDIYLGPGGWWDPNSGAIRSSMNRTLIKARILDTSSKEVIWKNEVQYRERPDIESKGFQEAISMVFNNLEKFR